MSATTRQVPFLQGYVFPIEPKLDFQLDGNPSDWASGHPKGWGREHESFAIPANELIAEKREGYERENGTIDIESAVSGDAKLLAISTEGRTLIYDISSRELRQELPGVGKLYFRPAISTPSAEDGQANDTFVAPAYTLLSSAPVDEDFTGPSQSKLILWDLDKNGRLLDDFEEEVDSSVFAGRAIDSIAADLEGEHEWTRDFINSSTLQADFERALNKLASKRRTRHIAKFEEARTPDFGSSPFSAVGRTLLYLRNEDVEPAAVVWDLERGETKFVLRGHTHDITWAKSSSNGQHIATVSMDGTLRMYNGETGGFVWQTGDSSGPGWAAAFSHSSEVIVWSSSNDSGEHLVQLHRVIDGEIIENFPNPLGGRCTSYAWHPDDEKLALCAGREAFIWEFYRGFGPDGLSTVVQHFELKDQQPKTTVFVDSVHWLEEGKKLSLGMSEGTRLVWDCEANTKELFVRPHGKQQASSMAPLYRVKDGESNLYISVDGDFRVRFYHFSVDPHPSWWEPGSRQTKEVKTSKKAISETGKYVNITKPKQTKTDKQSEGTSARDAWLEKGAELWTAE
ncbi:WD40-repeat-containing domain protein [Clohesyomyces aquaticus]|uniref:WD40-repeat-containing domain protein n=1 Tax=Clohesyomyces aquaticus TaxID=1231657 RepID=A0A1Y1YG00_9PLEO|nr:WD40-repeat-containing domain protein [Clohesyomyces aquaticus]